MLLPPQANLVMLDVQLAQTRQHAQYAQGSFKKMRPKVVFATVRKATKRWVTEAASRAHQIVQHAPTQTPALPATKTSNSKQPLRAPNVSTVQQTVSAAVDHWLALSAPRTTSFSATSAGQTVQLDRTSIQSQALARLALVVDPANAQADSSTTWRLVLAHEDEMIIIEVI